MAPLTWSKILRIDVDELDDDVADELFTQLLQFDTGDIQDTSKLEKLFSVTRGVMQIKGLQAEVALEELEQMAHHQGRMSARNEKKLTRQIAELQDELRKRDENGGNAALLKEKVVNLERENSALIEDLQDRDDKVKTISDDRDKLASFLKSQEEENSSLKMELDSLHSELIERRQQLDEMEVVARKSEKKDREKQAAKLKEQTHQIHQLLDDIQDLETENSKLRKQTTELKDKLEDAVQEMEKTTNNYIELKDALQSEETVVESLRKENESLRNELSELLVKLQAKAETDDEIVLTIQRRVDEWKELLSAKEGELAHYQQLVARLHSKLAASSTEAERSLVETLEKAIQERDDQIRLLRDQLLQATQELDQSTAMMEEMGSGAGGLKALIQLRKDLKESEASLQSTKQLLTQAEEDAQRKDVQLSEALAQMRRYEIGEYGLADAVAEIKEIKKQIRLRDSQIEDLTQQVNLADMLVGELSEENESLSAKLNLAPYKHSGKMKYKTQRQRDEEANLQLQSQVEILQDEVIHLRHELHRVNKLRTSLKNDDTVLLVEPNRLTAADDMKMQKALEVHKFLESENSALQQELLDLEEENQALLQAMREILDALQAYDGKEDIVLKCPALEQFVQVIELQQATGSVEQPSLHWKSQLERLQGQNDVLREEIKELRLQSQPALQKLLSPSIEQQKSIHLVTNDNAVSDIQLIKDQELLIYNHDVKKVDQSKYCSVGVGTDYHISSTDLLLDEEKKDAEKTRVMYRELLRMKENFDLEQREWSEKKLELLDWHDVNKSKLEQYEVLLRLLKQDEAEVKQHLSETVQTISQLSSNELSLARKCEAQQNKEKQFKDENEFLWKAVLSLESLSIQNLVFLQKYQELSNKRFEALQKILVEYIPSSELEVANNNYALLASKHKDLLAQLNTLSAETFKLLGKSDASVDDATRKRIATLEQHCQFLSTQLANCESHTKELEIKLCERVSKGAYENSLKKNYELESQISELHLEVVRTKSLVEVAHHQAESIDMSREALRSEVQQLRAQILDLQPERSEEPVSGKLNGELYQIEVKKQFEKVLSKIQVLHNQCNLLEQRYDEKENQHRQEQAQSCNKITFLTQVLQELRRKFSAAVSLQNQEKVIQELVTLRANIQHVGSTSQPLIQEKNVELLDTQQQVEKLKCQLKDAEKTILDRDIIVAQLRSAVPSTAEMPFAEYEQTKQALHVAQSNIACLQSRLQHKEQTAIHYQQLLENLRLEVDEQQKKQAKEAEELQESLQKAQHAAVSSKTEFFTELASRPGSASRNLTNELIMKVNQLEETAVLQESHLVTLSKKLQESRQEAAVQQTELDSITNAYHHERQRTDELEKQMRNLEMENQRLVDELAARDHHLHELKSMEAETDPILETVEKMQLELQSKEEQLKNMKDSLAEFRQEMSVFVQESLTKQKDEEIPSVKMIIEEKTKKLQGHLQNSLSKAAALQEELTRREEYVQELLLNIETVKTERDQKEEQLERVAREREDLRKRMARLETNNRLELERLRKEVRELEEELNQRAEKPFEQEEKAVKSREEVVRWEESKKWQQTVDRLRKRLRDKEQELESLQKTSKSLREQIIRFGKERVSLENRIKFLSQKVAPTELPPTIQELKSKVTQLEAELQAIRSSNKDELVEKNVFLLRRIEELEHELARSQIGSQISKGMEGSIDLKGKCNGLEKQVLKLTEENFELKLELEQLRVDLPRLRLQVASLEEYIDSTLNTDKINFKTSQVEIPTSKNQEDVQGQNRLNFPNKKATAETLVTKQLSPSTRRLLDAKTTRIADENNRLQKELQKVKQELDRSRTKIRRLEQESKKLNESLESKNREAADLKKRVPSPHTMGPHQYKAYVVTRMYEERISALEETLLVKKERIEDLERMLKETTLNEERLLVEKIYLRDKVDAYENVRLPVGADLEEQLRQVRTQLLKVTAEKSEMENVLIREGFSPDVTDSINEHSQFGRLLRESAEVRVDLKTCQLHLQKKTEEMTALKFDLNAATQQVRDLRESNSELSQLAKRQQVELDKFSQRFGFT